VGHGVKIDSRMKACFDKALSIIEGAGSTLDVRGFHNAVGSAPAAEAILKGDMERKAKHYKLAFYYFKDKLKMLEVNHKKVLTAEEVETFFREIKLAFDLDSDEYVQKLPKAREKERKIRKEKLSSKRPESTPLKRGENPCTLAPSEVVKEERVEGKWHWGNGTGRNKAEIRQGIILDLLRKHPEMTEPELTVGLKRSKRISASGIRVSLRTVKRDIAHLEAIGLLHREGTDFDGRWRVTEE
jgi:hypothetical protein